MIERDELAGDVNVKWNRLYDRIERLADVASKGRK